MRQQCEVQCVSRPSSAADSVVVWWRTTGCPVDRDRGEQCATGAHAERVFPVQVGVGTCRDVDGDWHPQREIVDRVGAVGNRSDNRSEKSTIPRFVTSAAKPPAMAHVRG